MASEEGSRPSRPLLKDYWDLCPSFTVPDAKEAAHAFNILEIVQATFYVMLLNDAVELSLVSRDMARGLKSILEGLRWTTFELWLSVQACPPGGAAPPTSPSKGRPHPLRQPGGEFELK